MSNLGEKGWQFPLRLVAFWMFFFGLFRAFFIGMNRPAGGGADAWASLRAALPLDASMAGYSVAVPVVLWGIGLFVPKNRLRTAAIWWSRLLVGMFVVVCAANVFLYREWSAVVNRRAVGYLKTPAALLDSLSAAQMLGIAAALVFGWVVFGWLFDRLVSRHGFFGRNGPIWVRTAAALLVWAAVFGLMRGFKTLPINESAVYFSENSFSNHAAVNPVWHLFHDYVEPRPGRNPFVFFEKKEAEKMTAAHFAPDSVRKAAFQLDVDNVVVIVMESMSARVFDDSSLTPNLHRLAREGLLFTDIYGSGFRTDQGLVAVLNGYPAQPDESIMFLSEKTERLPGLARFFAQNNHSTFFCYGGDLTFANLGVYLRNQGFQKIVCQKDFPADLPFQKWGTDDGRMLDRFAAEIDGLRPPFFATALTLSQHPPFDIPGDAEIGAMDRTAKFHRAAAYADRSIGAFFDKIKGKSWVRNTLFVLTADHGYGQPDGLSMETGAARRIPLIFFGEKLPRGIDPKLLGQTGCQSDVAASILGLFGQKNLEFDWSRDVFSKHAASFGYWTDEQILGWRDPAGEHLFDFTKKEWKAGGPAPEAQAFLQVLYDDFLAR